MVIHSKIYHKGIINWPHRERLQKIFLTIEGLDLPLEGKLADFGCSDGFILNLLQGIEKFKKWDMYGFDYSVSLLQRAKKQHSLFHFELFNLNERIDDYTGFFDMITCFETLEHVVNYKNAFDNLYDRLKNGGTMILSVPNEISFPGFVKFLGRCIRGDASKYKEVLKTKKDRFCYFFDLLVGRDIEKYRKRQVAGFGTHLGFNYKNLEKYIKQKYIKNNRLIILSSGSSFLGFNKIYTMKKQ